MSPESLRLVQNICAGTLGYDGFHQVQVSFFQLQVIGAKSGLIIVAAMAMAL